jgi:hypothetical protein
MDSTPLGQDSPVAGALTSLGTRRSLMASPAKLTFLTGLVLCLFMFLISFLDQRTSNMLIFGFLSAVFFFLLLRTSAPHATRDGPG